MSSNIGAVSNSEKLSAASLAEMAKEALLARPKGLRTDLLVQLMVSEDAGYIPLGRHVYGLRPEYPTHSPQAKALAHLKRNRNYRYDAKDDRWTYVGSKKRVPRRRGQRTYSQSWPPALILHVFREFKRRTGRLPDSREIRALDDFPSPTTVTRNMGCDRWADALAKIDQELAA